MHILRRLCVVLLAVSGCHSTLKAPTAASVSADLGGGVADGGVDAAVADLAVGDMACSPQVTSCVGLCGPVPDTCTGKNVQCGACDNGKVCDLVSHQCITPLTDCNALGAQCGNTRNSCGTRIFCGDCPSGQECDPDTNQCVTCNSNVSCAALGYQCGHAWLGCGPETATTDCGSCPAGANPVCNPYFNLCEPSCTPLSPAQLCANAHAKSGVECGLITDGCGGYVDCSGVTGYMCAAGFSCGAQGDPNRCEPNEEPTECEAAGKNCGTITSQCGGVKISCGTCTAPQVCNSNGVCGPPCTPMTCAQLGNPQCGSLPDGCGGVVKCNDCPDPTNYTCLSNNTCCKKKTCAVDYNGQCGTGLDDGCGGTEDCTCASGACQATTTGVAGQCCVNTASCAANSCNTTVTNTCTGAPIVCACNATTQYCDSTTNTCMAKESCAQEPGTNGHAPSQSGDSCSNGGAFDSGGGNLISCPCVQGEYCIEGGPPGTVVTGATKGTCCVDTACNAMNCGQTVNNTCTGKSETCGCPTGQFCSGGTCMVDKTCADYTNGAAGSECSNGNAFGNGAGGLVKCPCNAGLECITGAAPSPIASGSQIGQCCAPTKKSCGNACNTTIETDTCTGAMQSCACNATVAYCGTGNVCDAKKTCSNYQTNGGKPGDVCGSFPDGSGTGGTISCGCVTINGYANDACVGGVCTCVPKACGSCSDDGTSDGCGGTLSCKCTAPSPTCYPAAGGANGCCEAYTCTTIPGVPVNDAAASTPAEHPSCGSFDDHCGGGLPCPCPANNPVTGLAWPNDSCVAQPGTTPAYGFCECTPTPCTTLGAGPHPNDGCGHFVLCPS